MKITLDTNILVSAFISKTGHSAKILDICLTLEDTELVLSEEIIQEFTRVMSRDELQHRFDYTRADVEELANLLRKSAKMVRVKSKFKPVKKDQADNTILNTAYDGKCEYIVSGDHHLLELETFKRIRVVTPRQMLGVLSKRFGRFALSTTLR